MSVRRWYLSLSDARRAAVADAIGVTPRHIAECWISPLGPRRVVPVRRLLELHAAAEGALPLADILEWFYPELASILRQERDNPDCGTLAAALDVPDEVQTC